MITKSSLRASLDRAGIVYRLVESGEGWLIVAPSLGARLLGAGIGDESAFWASPSLSTRAWEAGGNSGGQRTWLAPESGPQGFFSGEDISAWRVPPELDPGAYREIAAAPGWRSYTNALCAHAADGSSYDIVLKRSLALSPRASSGGSAGEIGISIELELVNLGGRPIDRRVGLWSILQLPCREAGTILIPIEGEGGADPDALPGSARPYYYAPPLDAMELRDGVLRLGTGGGRRYKMGIPASRCSGKIAYLRRAGEGQGAEALPGARGWILVVMSFGVDPSGAYLDAPPPIPGEERGPGDAIQAYNDPGLGDEAFCEIEAHASAVYLAPGESQRFGLEIVVARGDRDTMGDILAREVSGQIALADFD